MGIARGFEASDATVATEPTLGAAVYRQIRADILACHLMPAERLRLEALRERYGVGASPIREALMRLEVEGLVILEQNKGFRVAPVSRDQLLDLMRTRAEIECLAVRWAIERGGVDWEAELLAAFHRLSRQPKATKDRRINADWGRAHEAFHTALVAASNSPSLMAIRESLFTRTERYVVLSILSKSELRDDTAEHERIMQAALKRNADQAAELMRTHIERTMRKVERSLIDYAASA